MLLRQIYDDRLAQAAWLIGCQRTGEALLIDPERDVDRYIDAARREGLHLTAVAETHIHADYLSGARELAEQTGARLYLSAMGGPDWSYAWLSKKQSGGSYDHTLLRDGDAFSIGNIEIRAIHTPGHTPEHICFLVTDRGSGATEPMGVATGDFVFVGDLGRPDLLETAAGQAGAANESAHKLFHSARSFLNLPEFLQVWPAHGAGSACGKALGAVPQSTVGYEKRFSPALKAAQNEGAFVDFILSGQPEPPTYFARMKRLNRDGPPILNGLPKPRKMSAHDLKSLDAREKSTIVADTRPWKQFRAGHLPGALYTPFGNDFPTVAGSFIEPEQQIHLIVDEKHLDEAIRCLVRVGLDNIVAWAPPEAVDEVARSGGALETTEEIEIDELQRRMRENGSFLLDVRRAAEFEAGHIPGAHNLAHTRLSARLREIPKDKPILINCQAGGRSARAAAYLQRAGYTVANVAGGFGAWEKSGAQVEK